MATITKAKLSGSTDGKGIKIAATSSTGTAVHTAVSGTTDIDEVWLYAVNSDSSDRKLTIEFGGTSSPDNLIEQTITAEAGLTLICPGLPLQNGAAITAFCATTNVVMIYGFVNKIDM